MAWKIKQRPEDFVVTEDLPDVVESSWKDHVRQIYGKQKAKAREDGKYVWLSMTKTGVDFFSAIGMIAEELKISTRRIAYAGTKDKHAVTTQTISIEGTSEKEIRGLRIPGLKFGGFRTRPRHVRLGEHLGNTFRITVRNIGKAEVDKARNRIASIRRSGFVNMFGGQRFGSVRSSNHVTGKKIVKGQPVRQLRGMPLRMQKMFVHAYQAWIWNMAAERYRRTGKWKEKGNRGTDTRIPLVGYKTDLDRFPDVRDIVARILRSEGVSPADFRNTTDPKLSSAGTARAFMVRPRGLRTSWSPDEMNRGRVMMVLRFWLPPGSYGTELVRSAWLDG